MTTLVQDTISECALLGSVLIEPDIALPALRMLDPDEFAQARHASLAALLIDMSRRGDAIDPILVAEQVRARGEFVQQLPASYLLSLSGGVVQPRYAAEYAANVRRAARMRQARTTAMDLAQRLDAMADTGEFHNLDELLAHGVDAFAGIPDQLDQAVTTLPPTLDDVMATEVHEQWLIPGLLGRGERVVITGLEGQGKSVMLRQVAACTAAGLHPFTLERVADPARVLHIDLENNLVQSKIGYAMIIPVIDRILQSRSWRSNLRIALRPEGIDLLAADAVWFSRQAAATSPDLIVSGSLYRMALGNPNSEEDARKVVSVLDQVRTRHNATLLLEAHAGHATTGAGARAMRPRGASLWMGWPEVGLGMTRHPDDPGKKRMELAMLEPWRGARVDRDWPEEIRHGNPAHRELPWMPRDAENYYAELSENRRAAA
ncbi:AAA family ATPase [Nakamurella leprariae]|uniref:AAA family ATPase n=1 Tax=Nakamurella leprariae TaxID=2803911 RepID=A0A939C1K2_9ACTN|nr:AAA family ATPase [Nakamurella leprariae]MBM9467244.1 AAA family ATPase [Nakamurella leprariae]